MAIFMVLLPTAFIRFYKSLSVRETCEMRNPQPAWTDTCPTSVLAQAMVFGIWPLSVLSFGAYNWMFPFFGFVLSGAAGAVCALLFGGVGVWLAFGSYRLKPVAWWSGVVMIVALGLSSVITYGTVDMMVFYEKMNLPPEQLEIMGQAQQLQRGAWSAVLGTSVGVIGVLSLLGYNHRYFFPLTAPTPAD